MNIPPELIGFLRDHRTFCITTHSNPDGDGLGSSLALSFALRFLGKETILYSRDRVPEFYRFLPGSERFTADVPSDPLPLLVLDCGERERAGIDRSFSGPVAVIDHHETMGYFGDVRWVEPKAAATGMMIYALIGRLGVPMTEEIATNLYTAISVDTGTFRYGNTAADVLLVAAELIRAGANPAGISVALYETWTERRFRLLIRVLDTLETIGGVAMTWVTNEMFAETSTSPEDTEHFSNFPRMIGTIEVSAFFRETDGGWKVSLRSKGDVNVASIAEKFHGGGHRNAAGYTVKGELTAVRQALLDAVRSRTDDRAL